MPQKPQTVMWAEQLCPVVHGMDKIWSWRLYDLTWFGVPYIMGACVGTTNNPLVGNYMLTFFG